MVKKPNNLDSKISAKSTKVEILKAYQEVANKAKEKKEKEAVFTYPEDLSLASAVKTLSKLKVEVVREINSLFDRLEKQANYLVQLKKENEEEEKRRKRQRQRDEEEYQLNLSLDHKKKEATFAEELEKRKKIFEVEIQKRMEEIRKKEEGLNQRSDELEDLQKKVARFPQELEEETRKATKELTESLKKEAGIERRLLTQQIEAEKRIAELQIKSLGETVGKQSREITSLKEQLVKATQHLKEIAVAVIRGKTEEIKENEDQPSRK